MATTEIWVPIRSFTRMGSPAWTADVPAGLRWSTRQADIADKTAAFCPPATRHYPIVVDDDDLPAFEPYRIPDADVPEEDKLLLGICRLPRQGTFMRSAEARALFRSIDAGTPERKQMIGRLLLRAVRRGLRGRVAEDLAKEKDLEPTG